MLLRRVEALPLKDRQVIVRELQHDQSHRGAVLIRERDVAPTAVGELIAHQLIANARIPALPMLTAGLIHRLHRVVMAVVEVRISRKAARLMQL